MPTAQPAWSCPLATPPTDERMVALALPPLQASDGAAPASNPRSATKASEVAAGGRGGNQRKAPTPVPPAPHQAAAGAGASAAAADDYAVVSA